MKKKQEKRYKKFSTNMEYLKEYYKKNRLKILAKLKTKITPSQNKSH